MKRFCSYCDAEREGDGDFCIICGTELKLESCCVSGHAEIQFNGEECPLCDTIDAIEGVFTAAEDDGKMSDIDWDGLRTTLKKVQVIPDSGSILACPGCDQPGSPKSDDGTTVQVVCQNTDCDYNEPYRVSSRELNRASEG